MFKLNSLKLIREFFGTVAECNFFEKSKNIACDVTARTKRIKLFVQIQWQLGYLMTSSYDTSFKRHIPIWGEICFSEEKKMLFFGTVTERAFREKMQSILWLIFIELNGSYVNSYFRNLMTQKLWEKADDSKKLNSIFPV